MQRTADLLRARRHLHRARGLSALSQPVAADPLAALADHALSRRLARRAATTTACSCPAMRPTIRTSASPRTSSSSSTGIERRRNPPDRARPAQRGRHARLLRGRSCGGCRRPRRSRCSAGPIPGYLVWAALIYAIAGTLLTHLIGRPLTALNFNQQRYEADFRFNLVRVRENSEQIALLHGETAERERLLDRFAALVENWHAHHDADQAAHLPHRQLSARSRASFRSWSSARPILPARCSSAA